MSLSNNSDNSDSCGEDDVAQRKQVDSRPIEGKSESEILTLSENSKIDAGETSH